MYFQVIEPYYPFNNSSAEDFTIGREDCEDRYSQISVARWLEIRPKGSKGAGKKYWLAGINCIVAEFLPNSVQSGRKGAGIFQKWQNFLVKLAEKIF